MYEKIKPLLFSLGFILFIAAASFGAGIYTGYQHGKITGNENYSDQIKRVFDIARDAIITERARLDSERSTINIERRENDEERNRLERERQRFNDERNLNKSEREDLRRLEYLIDENIKSKQGI